MAEKRLHHSIPQFYLRGFTDPTVPAGQTPWLWVRDKVSGIVHRRAPKNLAAEIGFYSWHAANGVDYEQVENELAKIESRAAFALRRFLPPEMINRREINPDLYVFLSWLAARVPWFKRFASETWKEFLTSAATRDSDIPEDPHFRCTLMNLSTLETRRFTVPEARHAIRSGLWTATLDQNNLIEIMRLQAWYFQNRFFPKLHWTLLTAPDGHFFLTSDRPLLWYVPGRALTDYPAALSHPEVELTVPLTKRHALLATPSPVPSGTGVHADDVNARTVAFSERFVASPVPQGL